MAPLPYTQAEHVSSTVYINHSSFRCPMLWYVTQMFCMLQPQLLVRESSRLGKWLICRQTPLPCQHLLS